MRVLITNDTDTEDHITEVKDYTEARHWIINHLDTSKQWSVQDITSASKIQGLLDTLPDGFGFNKGLFN